MAWLLVDGYNVAYAWLQGRALRQGAIDAVAAMLVDRLRILNDGGERKVVVVFDGKGDTVEAVQERGKTDVEVIYSPASLSADAVIEQIVCRAGTPGDFVVATRDNMLRETVFSLGASVMTPGELLSWVETEERKQSAELKQKLRENDRGFGNRLFW